MLSAINLKASFMSEKDMFEMEESIPIQSGLNITQDEQEHKLDDKSSFDDTCI